MSSSNDTRLIPGYDYSRPDCAVSPVTDDELSELEQTLRWTMADAAMLARHADLFRSQAEAMVDSWRCVIGAQPHLARWFTTPDGAPDDTYKARVKGRFIQWVIDVATRPHDRDWLNYQEEIGLRHTPAKKNNTDDSHTPSLVPLRFLLAFTPNMLSIRHFFSLNIADERELERLEAAWCKAVLLHLTLWSHAYVRDGLW